MSIFHIQNITEKPNSYVRDFHDKDVPVNYQSLKNEVRSSIIDKYSSFDRLGHKPASPKSKSPKKHQNTLRTIDLLFGKAPPQQETNSQSSPAKISGLKKKMQSIGGQESSGKFHLAGPQQDFKSSFYENSASKYSFLSPQTRLNTQETKPTRSGSLTSKFQVAAPIAKNMSSQITIQRLVEIQNLLEMAPASEIAQLPRNYLDELNRVANSITRNLRHFNDLRIKI